MTLNALYYNQSNVSSMVLVEQRLGLMPEKALLSLSPGRKTLLALGPLRVLLMDALVFIQNSQSQGCGLPENPSWPSKQFCFNTLKLILWKQQQRAAETWFGFNIFLKKILCSVPYPLLATISPGNLPYIYNAKGLNWPYCICTSPLTILIFSLSHSAG